MTVVVDDHQLSNVDCVDESQGQASTGWDCLFAPSPHLCTFESDVVSDIRFFYFVVFSSLPRILPANLRHQHRFCADSANHTQTIKRARVLGRYGDRSF